MTVHLAFANRSPECPWWSIRGPDGGGMSITDAAEPVAAIPGPRALRVVPSGAARDSVRLAQPARRPAVVCSFHTPDGYYRSHAEQLRRQLAGLELPHEITEVSLDPGSDWADATRRKLSIVLDACRRHPEAMVLWIDVDCRLTHLPDYVRNSSADLVGFQRSFRSPLLIGYQNRTRFWEPSFWGVNATEGAASSSTTRSPWSSARRSRPPTTTSSRRHGAPTPRTSPSR
jgi:hypothetical protein